MMSKRLSFLFIFFAAFFFIFSQATKQIITDTELQPQQFKSFKINNIKQFPNSCSYSVSIKTSCSSITYTRDQISLAFGDAYGNQVYAPRIDNPSTRTFERCSTDTFRISGPCMYGRICYQYFYRMGYDGWIPESVTIYPSNSRGVVFTYNTYIPYGVWFGFNFCNNAQQLMSSAAAAAAAAAM